MLSQPADFYGGTENDDCANHQEGYPPFSPPGWSNDTIISVNDAKESIHSDIEVDLNKNIHIVWKDNGSATNGIYYRKYDGSNWGAIIDLSNSGINSNSPTIATDTGDNLHVVFLRWSGVPFANYNVSYKRYDDLGGTWSPEEVITTDDELGLSARPKVVSDSNMNVYVFWLDERDTPLTIWYKVNDGTGWGPDIDITGGAASPNGYFGVTVSPDDYVHLCWQDYRSGTAELYHKFFDGSSWSAEGVVTNDGAARVYPRMAPDVSNNIHLFYGGSAKLHYRMWDAVAQTWGGSQTFSTAFFLPHADIAVDLLTGDRHVVFYDFVPPPQIFYKKYDFSTGTWEPDLQLTIAAGDSYDPQIATDSDNLVYLTWYDYRCGTGQEEIFFKQSLPEIQIQLSSFIGYSMNEKVFITWRTESENGNFAWRLDRSFDPKGEFKTVYYKKDDEPTTPKPTEYHFMDEDVSVGKIYYYKLADVDINGKITWHYTIAVRVIGKNLLVEPRFAPNPFMERVSIEYAVTYSGFVSLKIMDIGGRVVNRLFEGYQKEGVYTKIWDGTDLRNKNVPENIYFIHLDTPKESYTRKLIRF
ncbi:MAG: hypothetical protein E3J87_07790 [Candidatus Cloacimonadota bacterium]|nr:MAG: hypothetical protein E3J87_07790 [Candidatus Cloacimonadota bacterium]